MNIQQAFNAAAADMAPLDIQLRWLEAAGFQDVDCWYKNFSFAVFGGHRPTYKGSSLPTTR